MTGPERMTPSGVSRSDMRKALAMGHVAILMCALGLAGAFMAGIAARAWRTGDSTVTLSLMALLGYLLVVAAVHLFVESLRFLHPVLSIIGGVVLMLAAIFGAVLLAMRPGPGVAVSPWVMLGLAAALLGVTHVMALASARWLRRHNNGQGEKEVRGLLGTFLVLAVLLALGFVLDPDGTYLVDY